MWLHTKLDKQRDNYCQVDPIDKSISKQKFVQKFWFFLFFVFNLFVIIKNRKLL